MSRPARLEQPVQPRQPAPGRGLRPYPAYRPSGVPFTDRLPAHWHAKPLKHVVRINPEDLPDRTDPDYKLRYIDIGNVDYVAGIQSEEDYTFENAPSRARRRVRNGDTIVSTVRTYLKAIARIVDPPDNLIVSTGFAVLRSTPQIDPGYLYRLVQSTEFIGRVVANSVGVSYPAIAPTTLGRMPIWLPPLPEQRAIAAFLDRETAKIDGLVGKKRRLIELLREKRTAMISQAVTKGLDPAAPTKPTGIDWLGHVPKHWQVMRLKFVAHIQGGVTLGKKYDPETTIRRPYLRVANVQDGYLDLDEITNIDIPPDDAQRHTLHPGDVLMTEGGDFDKLGRGYLWEGQIEGCLHQNHIFAVRPDQDRLRSRFLAWLLTSFHAKHHFTSTSQQTTNLATTNRTKIGDFLLTLPPIHEQQGILRRLETETCRLDTGIQRTQLAILRLDEYRSALISAAVTGQVDVRQPGMAEPTGNAADAHAGTAYAAKRNAGIGR